jgi:hypothetical protein
MSEEPGYTRTSHHAGTTPWYGSFVTQLHSHSRIYTRNRWQAHIPPTKPQCPRTDALRSRVTVWVKASRAVTHDRDDNVLVRLRAEGGARGMRHEGARRCRRRVREASGRVLGRPGRVGGAVDSDGGGARVIGACQNLASSLSTPSSTTARRPLHVKLRAGQ